VLLLPLTALHVVSPRFLLRHSRYAILAITLAAAIITPTQDTVNLALLVVPLCLLFFLGVLASPAGAPPPAEIAPALTAAVARVAWPRLR